MNFKVELKSVNHWGSGGNGEITIINDGDTISPWAFDLITENFTIISFWRLTMEGTGNQIIIKPPSWQLSLATGEIFTSGFEYVGSSTNFMVSTTTSGVNIINDGGGNIDPIPDPDPEPIDTILTTDKKVIAYFTEWSIYDRAFSVNQIPATKLTHIVYSFMLPNPSQADYDILKSNSPYPPLPYRPPPQVPEGAIVFHDEYAGLQNIEQLKILKAKYPHIKVLISVGGWTLSWTLSKVAKTPSIRKVFVQTATDFIINNGFDGIDIDWEYPGKQGVGYNYVDPNDGQNFATMLSDFRTELDIKSPDKYLEITAAIGCNPQVIQNYIAVEPYLDLALMMTYDFAGSFDPFGGHLTAIYHNSKATTDSQFNVYSAINNIKQAGYDISKILVGSPMYGRGWSRVVPNDPNEPLFGSASGTPVSFSGAAGEPGLSSWKHIRDVIGTNGFIKYYDDVAKGVYIHNSTSGETWSYEDPDTAALKAQYVINNSLAGIFFWEISDDTRDGIDNILDSVVNVLNNSSNPTPDPDPDPDPEPEPKPEPEPEPSTNLKITLTNTGTNDIIISPNQTIEFNVTI